MKLLLTVLLMEMLVGIEGGLLAPCFPNLQNEFNISTFMVTLLLGVNIISSFITAIIIGSIGDRYNRKSIIIVGILLFIIGILFCICNREYWMLLTGRVLQGVGITIITILGYLIIADSYSKKQQQKFIGVLNGIITLSAASAPIVGNYINYFFNWQGNFFLLLVLGIVNLLAVILFVPKGKNNSNIKFSVKEYIVIFKSKKILYYFVAIIFLIQPYTIFSGLAPILYIQDLKVSAHQFGIYQGLLAGIFALTSFYSNSFSRKFGQEKCFLLSIFLLIIFIFGTIMLVVFKVNDPLLITMVTQLVIIGMVYPRNLLWILLFDYVPEAKARVSAIITVCRIIITAMNLQVASYFYSTNFTPIAIAMCFTTAIALFACYKLGFIYMKNIVYKNRC